MPTNYNATITTHHLTETDIDHYIEALNTYHVAISNPRANEGQIILTLPATKIGDTWAIPRASIKKC